MMDKTSIKIEELSVGDWVQIKANGLPVRVKQIKGKFISAESDSTRTAFYYLIDNFAPIPLTPEILEKNGCLHTAENRILCDWFDGRITVRKYNNREWYELFVGSNQMKFKLMFVHQLQHALRLAGVEKEIELC